MQQCLSFPTHHFYNPAPAAVPHCEYYCTRPAPLMLWAVSHTCETIHHVAHNTYQQQGLDGQTG